VSALVQIVLTEVSTTYISLEVEVEVTVRLTVSHSVSMSWHRVPLWDLDQILFPVGMLLSEICGLVSRGALSDERTGLQFAV
jgi:hypothetical protein